MHLVLFKLSVGFDNHKSAIISLNDGDLEVRKCPAGEILPNANLFVGSYIS
jgi:hypothetical protein